MTEWGLAVNKCSENLKDSNDGKTVTIDFVCICNTDGYENNFSGLKNVLLSRCNESKAKALESSSKMTTGKIASVWLALLLVLVV